jgi:hypothetical protein
MKRSFRIMRNIGLIALASGLALVAASAASAQSAGGPPPGAGSNMGGPRPQDIAAGNRQSDSDYNTLAGRGVKVTNEDRTNLPKPKRSEPGPATLEDIRPGAVIRDIKGVQIGTIVSADAEQAVVDTGGSGKIGVPLIGFGKDSRGLLLDMTAAKFRQMVAQAHASVQDQSTQSN